LHLTPPAVSIQIAQLERHAGAQLFERLGRRLFLTPAGQAGLREAEAVPGHVRQAEGSLGGRRGGRGGGAEVGGVSAGGYFFPSLLAEFCRQHEGVKLQLSTSNREDLIERIDRNAIDFAVMGQPPERRDLFAAAFAPHPMVMVASPTHRLVRERALPLAAAAREPLIARGAGSATPPAIDRTFPRHRIPPPIPLPAPPNA